MQTAHHWVLPKEPASSAQARRHLRATCAELPPVLLQTALLLTSELVTNAVRYGGTRIVLTVRGTSGTLRVEVHDDGPLLPHLAVARPTAVGGRGLHLVEALADQWGTRPESPQPGKSVWFTLRNTG
jgi:anti-sigma regulatory factor (Ser/Thr protein kinase)